MPQDISHMTPEELSTLLKVSVKALRDWRATARGPAWLKTGDGENCRIRYSREAVERWIAERTNPTAPSHRRRKTK